jgi:hypothetical protein
VLKLAKKDGNGGWDRMSEEESLERVERVGRALENDFKSGGTPKLNVVFFT